MRWLCIDHGTVRLGVAVGDTQTRMAAPVKVIPAVPLGPAIEQIRQIAQEYDAGGIIVGWPINMDDSEGPQGRLAREMATELATGVKLDVRLWDERLSSFTADSALAGHMTRMKRRARQDAIAAAAILQDFLNDPDGEAKALRPGDVGEKKT